jgi:hypothetical protein
MTAASPFSLTSFTRQEPLHRGLKLPRSVPLQTPEFLSPYKRTASAGAAEPGKETLHGGNRSKTPQKDRILSNFMKIGLTGRRERRDAACPWPANA